MTVQSPPGEEIMRELVEPIVQALHPRTIILFGSAARGQMGPKSDLIVLVVMPDGTRGRETF
jgi:predicted nucleotidyltransferase